MGKTQTLFILILFLCGCASNKSLQQTFDSKIADKKCAQALEEIPHENKINKLLSVTKTTAGTTLSYSAQGVGYTVDFIVDAAKVALVMVPMALLVPKPLDNVASSIHSDQTIKKGDFFDLSQTPTGNLAYEKTKNLRCPNVDEISQNMRSVASCYAEQSELKKAEKILLSVLDYKDFFECVSPAEKKLFLDQLASYTTRSK